MFGQRKRIKELEEVVYALSAQVDDAEVRIAGLVKLAGANEELDKRFALAIDEVERRQANAMHATNALFAGLSKRVEALAAPGSTQSASDSPPRPEAAPAPPVVASQGAGSPHLAIVEPVD